MKSNGYPQRHAPEKPRNAKPPATDNGAATEQRDASQRNRQPVPDLEPPIESFPLEIGHVTGDHRSLAVHGAMHDPSHVGKILSVARRVGVARLRSEEHT